MRLVHEHQYNKMKFPLWMIGSYTYSADFEKFLLPTANLNQGWKTCREISLSGNTKTVVYSQILGKGTLDPKRKSPENVEGRRRRKNN